MDALRQYLNSLSVPEQFDMCAECETTVGYLRKAISTGQVLAPVLCSRIELATNGAVTRMDLRPDDWDQIWLELAHLHPERAAECAARRAAAVPAEVSRG